MIKRAFVMVLAGAGLVATPVAAAEIDAILACAKITEDAARLKCFDGEIVKLKAQEEKESREGVTFFGLFGTRNKAPAEDAAKATTGAEAGKAVPEGALGVSRDGKVIGISAKIVSVSVDQRGYTILILDNGQVWRTIESGTVRGAREDADIKIQESAFNGYRLEIVGRSGEYRVIRLL